MHSEDNALMEKVKNGDKNAYETLVIRHRTAAIYFANSFVSDFHSAEDIVQDCFAKVYINRMAYQPSYSFKTYLFTVIRNSCIDYLRRKKKREFTSFEDLSESTDDTVPEDMVIRNEQMNEIYTHLNSLPQNYRTVLQLYAIHGMSYEQIAKIMGKSTPQIKVTIHRARKKLKNLCKGVDIS